MKRNNKLALIALSLIALGSTPALAQNHWGYGDGMQQRGGTPMTTEQQATAQKIYDDYYSQTSALRQQLTSKRYEYNALLTASSPDTAKINAVAKEMEALNQSLDRNGPGRRTSRSGNGLRRVRRWRQPSRRPYGNGPLVNGFCRMAASPYLARCPGIRFSEGFGSRLPVTKIFISNQQ